MILGKQGGDTAVLLSRTPDGLNVNLMTQEDLTMTLDDFQRVSWTLRAVDEKVKIWSDVTNVLLTDNKI